MGAYKSISKIADDSEIFHSIQISLDQSIQALQDALAEIKNQKDFLHKEEDLTLEQIESRLFAMREQARRHHCDTPDLPKKLEELEEEFYNLEAGDDYINTLKESEKEAKKLFFQEASNTYKERLIATRKLVEKVKQELVPLKLDRLNFDITFEELSEEKWNEEGIHKVEFYISTNVGQKLGPLQSVASGGELSRIMLALKVILNESQPHQRTLIFDEIDTGLGGAVADAMGYRLKLLSNKSQVLSVTHSPQIAVYSDYHYVVHKEHKQNHTETAIHFLQEQKDREQEIARMISGASVTKEAEAAAAKLLKESMHG
jgi:DNA repair protein RecN (Recombination protein N)